MSSSKSAPKAFGHLLVQALRYFFLLLMVVLPVPVVALFPRPGRAARRNLPSEVLKKD